MLSWLQRRFELRRLSDEELATRVDKALGEREPLEPTPPPDDGHDGKGLLHDHVSSRFPYVSLEGSDPDGSAMSFLMSRRFREWALYSPNARIAALDREIRALLDELERRVKAGRRQSARRG